MAGCGDCIFCLCKLWSLEFLHVLICHLCARTKGYFWKRKHPCFSAAGWARTAECTTFIAALLAHSKLLTQLPHFVACDLAVSDAAL
eukprot:2804832-Karenia_brevis.AAC.1